MTLIRAFVIALLLCGFWWLGYKVIDQTHIQAHDKGYSEGQIQSIGRPIKYKDLPRGQYRVIAVVNEYSQTAVVQRITLADGFIREDAKEYFLVTDMMPQQMKVDYIWGEVQ